MTPERAGLYCRISLDRAGRALGVTRQEEDLRSLATSLRWGIHDVYVENDTSASKGKVRPVFERMKRDCEQGVLDGWLVYNVDRQTRRLSELATFLDWRAQYKIPFATTEGDNTETANGVMILQIKGALAQQEAARISERVSRAAQQRREDGKPSIGGPRMFGFTPSGTETVPAEAQAIREGCQMLLAGATYGEVMRHWTSRGHQPVTAPAWVRESVRSVYRSGRVAGLVTHKGEVIGESSYPGIISRAEWEALREVTRHGPSRPAGYGSRVHVLAGFVFCGACGATMVVQADRYKCVKHRQGCGTVTRNKQRVDEYVDVYVRAVLEDLHVEAAPQPLLDSDIADVEAHISEVRARYETGGLEPEDFFPLLSGLRAQVKQLRKEQAVVVQRQSRAQRLDDPLAVWLGDDLVARRELLAGFLTGVYIKPVGKIGRAPLPDGWIEIV